MARVPQVGKSIEQRGSWGAWSTLIHWAGERDEAGEERTDPTGPSGLPD